MTAPQVDDSPRLTTAVTAAHIAGSLGMGVMPLLLGGFVDHLGFSEASAGALITAELTAACLASLGLASRLTFDSRTRWGLLGAGLAALGHACSALTANYEALLAARAVAGLGEGAVLAAASAAAAGVRDPDRLFAKVAVIEGVALGLLLVALPWLMGSFAVSGAFWSLAALCLLAMPWMSWLPDAVGPTVVSEHGASRNRALALTTLLALFVVSVAFVVIWSLSERIGLRAGLSPEGVGAVLGIATVVGLLGAGAAAWLGTRRGRRGPLLLGLFVSTVSMVWIALATRPVPFVVNQLVWAAAFFFLYPYAMGVAAALDTQGRWTAAASGVSTAGNAIGPLVGGLLAATATGLAMMVGFSGLLGALLLATVLRHLDHRV